MRERVRLIGASNDFNDEKGRALRTAQDDVKTLETQRDRRRQLRTHRRPPPIDAPSAEPVGAMQQAPLVSNRGVGVMQVSTDRSPLGRTGRSWRWYSDPNGLGLADSLGARHTSLPEALAQVREPFQTFTKGDSSRLRCAEPATRRREACRIRVSGAEAARSRSGHRSGGSPASIRLHLGERSGAVVQTVQPLFTRSLKDADKMLRAAVSRRTPPRRSVERY
jgi:hypothetical protein